MQDNCLLSYSTLRRGCGVAPRRQTSLRRWTNAGRLPCLRVGGRHERRFGALTCLRSQQMRVLRDSLGHVVILRGCTPAISVERVKRRHSSGRAAPTHALPARRRTKVQRAGRVTRAGSAPRLHDLETGRLTLAEFVTRRPAHARIGHVVCARHPRPVYRGVYVLADVSGGGLGRLPLPRFWNYGASMTIHRSAVPVTTAVPNGRARDSGLDARMLQCMMGPFTGYRLHR